MTSTLRPPVLSVLLALTGFLPSAPAAAADGPMDHVMQGRARPTAVAGEPRPQAWNIAEYSAVRLVPIETGAAPNQHPRQLPVEQVERWLAQARLQGGREALFVRDEVEAVAKGVVAALQVARPDQDLVLLSSARRSGPLTPMLSVTARLFVADGALQLLVQGERLNLVTPFRSQQVMPTLAFGTRTAASDVRLQREGPPGPRPDWLVWPLEAADPRPGTPPAPVASDTTLEDRLRRLKSLHEQGLISAEDYAHKRRSLLDAL